MCPYKIEQAICRPLRFQQAALSRTCNEIMEPGDDQSKTQLNKWRQVYNWGEAGYALSHGAVAQITSKFNNSNACQVHITAEAISQQYGSEDQQRRAEYFTFSS